MTTHDEPTLDLLAEYQRRGLSFSLEDFCFKEQLAFIKDPARFKAADCSRRAGKCLKQGTEVLTPRGPLPIEQLKVGALVYGYSRDGSVSLCPVTAVIDQGIKPVVDFGRQNKVIVSATMDHRWLTHRRHQTERVRTSRDITGYRLIRRELVQIPCGEIAEPHAYAIGALLGDGCTKDPRNGQLYLSSEDDRIPSQVAATLGAAFLWRSSTKNFTWIISQAAHGGRGRSRTNSAKVECHYYDAWMRGRGSAEKHVDLAVLNSWDRRSCLAFLAGLLDTDGSVFLGKDRSLAVRWSSNSPSIIKAIQFLLKKLCLINRPMGKESRADHYVVAVKSNLHAKRLLKELTPFLAVDRKKYAVAYDALPDRSAGPTSLGLKRMSEPYAAPCWDITVANDTHLYLLANEGLITHNTVGIAADLMNTARSYPGMACLYLTLSRLNAKRILWRDLTAINRNYNMGGKAHETELTLTMPNGHIIYLSGAKDKNEVEKYRGFPLKKIYIDEAQAFRPYLQELVDDVLAKALYDYNGSLALTGTPPPIPVGFFHDCVHSPSWSRHSWTMFENPHLKLKSGRDPMELVLEDCHRMGVSLDDPRIQRECFGKWTVDLSSLVFKWSEANHYDILPVLDQYVLGVDLGHDDADALSLLGWAKGHPQAYLVEEVVKTKQGVTELAAQVDQMIRKYQPLSVVMDTGGLGKKIAEELRRRYSLPIKAAEKSRKFEYIELVNDALRTRRLFAKRTSVFAQDASLLEWDRDKSRGDRLVVSDAYHSDAADALLYAYREAMHWLETPELPKAQTGSTEWLALQEAELWERVQLQQKNDQDDPAVWPQPEWE